MKIEKINLSYLAFGAVLLLLGGCFPTEEIDLEPKQVEERELSELDQYIKNNFLDKYNMVIRYRYEDKFVDPNERAIPPRLSAVRPMLEFIQEYWIDPYLEIEGGEEFFKAHVPPEIVLLGGPIYNIDGTVTLGTATAGARVALTDVNSIDPDDEEWRNLQLNVIYHEFAHIVHQRYKLPPEYETITPSGYSGPGSWFTLSEDEALVRGYVTPYATLNPNEDYAETSAFYLFDSEFEDNFTSLETNCETNDCEERNAGRAAISQKVAAIINHYEKVTGVSLEDLRNAIQAKLQ